MSVKKEQIFLLISTRCKIWQTLHSCHCSFHASCLMKSVCMFMWSWGCLLFLVIIIIIIKQSQMPAVVVKQRSRSAQPPSLPAPRWGAGGADDQSARQRFVLAPTTCESHQQQNQLRNPRRDESIRPGSDPEL